MIGIRSLGLFGRKPPYGQGVMPGDQPDYGMGDFPRPHNLPQSEPPQKPGFFGQGGAGRAIAGTIGDVLLQHNNMAPIYAPTMQLRQRMEHEEQQRQRQRMENREDKQWEWQNKPPTNNDTVADYEFIVQTLGPEAGKEFLKNKANPPVWRQGADGNFYRVDTPQGAAGLPTAPVGKLTPITGGGVGNGTGGF